MQQAVCQGYVQNSPDGFAVCTDFYGTLQPWVDASASVETWVLVGAGVGLLQVVALACLFFVLALRWKPKKKEGEHEWYCPHCSPDPE